MFVFLSPSGDQIMSLVYINRNDISMSIQTSQFDLLKKLSSLDYYFFAFTI